MVEDHRAGQTGRKWQRSAGWLAKPRRLVLAGAVLATVFAGSGCSAAPGGLALDEDFRQVLGRHHGCVSRVLDPAEIAELNQLGPLGDQNRSVWIDYGLAIQECQAA